MIRAALYARISLDPDGGQTATARQLADCHQFAAARGWDVVDVYEDPDISAFKRLVRPEFDRLKADVTAGRIDVVLAWKLDRLWRRARDFADLDDACEAAGARIVTVVDGIDTATSAGRLVATMMTGMARAESENISLRVKRKSLENAQAGRSTGGGIRPFGYQVGRRAIVPEEADLIREAASRALNGESMRGIAFDWAMRDVRTPAGGQWQAGPLRRLLSRPSLAGIREHNGSIYEGTWEPILSRGQHAQLQRLLDDPARRHRAHGTARAYVLSGFLRCGLCGERLISRPRGDKTRRYACVKQPGLPSCGRLARLAEPIEDLVRDAVLLAIESPELAEAMARAAEAPAADVEDLAARLREDETALDDLARDHYVERIIGRSEFLAARDGITMRIERTRRALADMTAKPERTLDLISLGSTIRKTWNEKSLDEKRHIIAAVIASITIHPARRGARVFDPALVEITWRF